MEAGALDLKRRPTAVAGPMNNIRPCHFKTVLVTERAKAVDLHLLQLLVLTFLKQEQEQ